LNIKNFIYICKNHTNNKVEENGKAYETITFRSKSQREKCIPIETEEIQRRQNNRNKDEIMKKNVERIVAPVASVHKK
jgi:hypothetical protein